MSKIKNHGIIDFNCNDILKLLLKAEKKLFSEYDEDAYWQHRQNDLEFTKKMSGLYNETARNYHYNYDLSSILPDTFYSTTGIKKDPTGIGVFQLLPGKFTPPHRDRFGTFLTNNPDLEKFPTKFWIPLTRPSIGHALFFEDEVVYNIPEGTILELPKDALHSACNAGTESRIIMTITGVKNGK
jgi:hypothetical protein